MHRGVLSGKLDMAVGVYHLLAQRCVYRELSAARCENALVGKNDKNRRVTVRMLRRAKHGEYEREKDWRRMSGERWLSLPRTCVIHDGMRARNVAEDVEGWDLAL